MRKITAIFLTFLLCGCGSTVSMAPGDLAPLGGKHFESDFQVFYIASSGGIADSTFIALSKSEPSGDGKQLAQLIQSSVSSPVNVVVVGPNSAKTSIVIKNAADLSKGGQFPNFHLVFVGDETDSAELQGLITALGAKFDFEPFGI